MNKNTMIANGVTVGGIMLCLAIAQFPLLPTVGILAGTVACCIHLTKKEGE